MDDFKNHCKFVAFSISLKSCVIPTQTFYNFLNEIYEIGLKHIITKRNSDIKLLSDRKLFSNRKKSELSTVTTWVTFVCNSLRLCADALCDTSFDISNTSNFVFIFIASNYNLEKRELTRSSQLIDLANIFEKNTPQKLRLILDPIALKNMNKYIKKWTELFDHACIKANSTCHTTLKKKTLNKEAKKKNKKKIDPHIMFSPSYPRVSGSNCPTPGLMPPACDSSNRPSITYNNYRRGYSRSNPNYAMAPPGYPIVPPGDPMVPPVYQMPPPDYCMPPPGYAMSPPGYAMPPPTPPPNCNISNTGECNISSSENNANIQSESDENSSDNPNKSKSPMYHCYPPSFYMNPAQCSKESQVLINKLSSLEKRVFCELDCMKNNQSPEREMISLAKLIEKDLHEEALTNEANKSRNCLQHIKGNNSFKN